MPYVIGALVLGTALLAACSDPSSTLIPDDLAGGPDGAAGDLIGASDLVASTAPKVAMTFSGCSPDFNGNLIVVANNQSMAVTRGDAPLLGQIQLHLTQTSGVVAISTAERVQDGTVINLITDSVTWTNISSVKPDPIKGVLTIHSYDEAAGKADLEFEGVVVENVQDHRLCTMDGTLVTHGKTF
jgi:hypothetical protein